jgi:hypothetical protein
LEPALGAARLRKALDAMVERRWLICENGRYLCLATRPTAFSAAQRLMLEAS